MHDIKRFLANLTNHPGVYQMLDEKGEVLYVGKAKNLKKRVSSYFSHRSQDQKTLSMVAHIKNIDITITHNEGEAVLLECNLIKKHRPRYNVLLRDDKSYPYILITNLHSYPRIDIYRGPRKKNGLYFGPYPSAHSVRETISLLQKIFRIRTCRDSYFEARTRPCLLYQIDRCTGPCVGLIDKEAYAHQVNLAILFLEGKSHELIEAMQTKMEQASMALDFELAANYRDQISRLRQIQDKQYVNVGGEGNADIIGYAIKAGVICLQLLSIRGGEVLGSRAYFPTVPLHSSEEEILSAFITQHYLNHPSHIEAIPRHIVLNILPSDSHLIEEGLTQQSGHKVEIIKPVRGEKRKWLLMATTSAQESLVAQLVSKTNVAERAKALQALLSLPHLPKRIECFDISHTLGEATVASCVVFDHAGPIKSDYRRFNITAVTPGDDVAAMRQVLERRFKRLQKEGKFPDLVLIDGGPTQLSAAQSVLNALNIQHVLLVGVSKGPDRKAGFESLHIENQPPIHLPSDSLALHFIQQIRDEAHRFAITGHRQRRDKTRRQSTLEMIPGIGAKRRRDLLRYFGGIQGVAHASLDELSKVPGISRSLAERIFAALHDATV